jgi:amino acid efflux transporter
VTRPTDSPSGRVTPQPAKLRKTITLPQAVALYTGAVLGSGILITPGIAASTAGPASLLAWVFDGLLGIPLALTLAALSARFPDAGGVAAYTKRAFGAAAGSVVGWLYFFAAAVAQTLVALTGGHYVALAAGWGSGGTVAVAAVTVSVALVANLFDLRLSARLQVALAAAIVAILITAIAAAVGDFHASALTPFAPHGWSAIGDATVLVFFAFFGWEAITHLSSEFRDPARDVPIATVITFVVVTTLYLAVALAVVGTRSYGTPAVDRTAVAELVGRSVGVSAERTAGLAALLITLATNNAFVAATSRLGYALAREQALPRPLGRLNDRGVPTIAVLVVAAIAGGGLAVAYVRELGAEDFLIVPNSSVIIVYIGAMAAGVRLLERRARILAAVALLLCLAMVPFVHASLLIPAGVGSAALVYRRLGRSV